MKINYKNTALGFLEDPEHFNFYTPEYSNPLNAAEEEEFKYSLRQAAKTSGFKEQWLTNVKYVTNPFYKAYQQAANKVKSAVTETVLEDVGTLIIPWPNHTQTVFYAIQTNGDKADWQYEVMIIMFTKSPHSDNFGLDLFIYLSKDAKDYRERIWKGFEEQGRDLSYWVADLMCFKTFLKYADVETKVVNAKRRERHLGEKYVNETNSNIEVLDSTYFTTISRTEGFGVRGHFRMQPYGIGLTQKRLQWITDFQKNGYTRKAKILNQ